MLGRVLKGTANAIGGGARRIATNKLMNRKKKTDARRASAQKMMGSGNGGGEQKGGELAVIPKSSLVASPAGAIQKYAGGDQQQSGGDNLEGMVLRIKTSVIQVESLLGNSVAFQKKQLDDQRKAQEQAQLAAAEKDLEKKKPKEAKGKSKIKLPGQGIFSSIISFISNVIFGFVMVRMLEFLPMLQKILPILGTVADVFMKVAGFILNAFATIVDWGYKLVEMGRGLVKGVFGEDGAKKFDTFMTNIKDLIQGFLIWKILGEKIFKAIVSNIKNAFKFASNIVRRALIFVKRLIGPAGRKAIKAVLGKVGQFGSNLLSKGTGLLSKGAGVVGGKIGGLAAKIFGPAAKVVAPALKAATPAVKGFAKRIPILGPIIVAVVSLLSGEPIGQALFKSVGAGLGGALGTFIPIPVLGTLIGETIGVFVGDLLYELMLGGGVEAAGKKLKDTFNTFIEPIFNFFKDGIGRFFTNFPSILVPEGGGRQTILGKLLPFLADSEGRVTKIPDLSLLTPFGTGKLIKHMGASFFPNMFGGGKSSDSGTKSAEISKEQSSDKNNIDKDVSKKASYEETGVEVALVPVPGVTDTSMGGSGSTVVTNSGSDSSEDAYASLDMIG